MSILVKRISLCLISIIMAVLLFGCKGKVEPSPTITASATVKPTATYKPSPSPSATQEEEASPTPDSDADSDTINYQSEIESEKSCFITLYGDIVNPDAVHKPISWNGTEKPMGETESCGWQFIATTSVSQMEISTATYGNTEVGVTLTIYNWNQTFADTTLGDVVYTERISNIKDNQIIRVKFSDNLPAGEYLCVLTNPNTSFTVYTIPYTDGVEYPYARFYANGEPQTGVMPQVRVRYANTPVEKLMEFTM